MDDTREEPPAAGTTMDTDRATLRTVQRIGLVSASVSGLVMLVALPAIDPLTGRLWITIDVILAMVAGWVVATLATTTWMQSHGRPVRRPKGSPLRFGLLLLQTLVLLVAATILLALVGRVAGRLPFAAIFVCAPVCALVAEEIVDRMVSRQDAG